MRLLVLPATAAMMATAILTLSAETASARHYYRHYASGGYGARPYWQGEPTDRLPIWRYGYYQGNDPDNFIRLQLMRDPKIPSK